MNRKLMKVSRNAMMVLSMCVALVSCANVNKTGEMVKKNMKNKMEMSSTHSSKPAVYGYDAVSYFTMNKAVRGSGMITADYKGETYLFSSNKNKEMFVKSPSKYLPEYGGYCAFGASMGKEFYSDPTIFAVVDNKLYLNLNKDIQMKWNKDRSSMIKNADKKWKMMSHSH